MSDEIDPKVSGSVYFYTPNKGAAIFFTVAFASSGLFHLWQCFHFKCFKLTALLALCCALLTAAFATRGYNAVHYDDAQVYTASTLLIYISPPVLQLANFHILGHLFYFVPYFALMHPARMFLTFASITAVIEILTVMGIAYLANRDLPAKSTQLGDTMTKASLVLQVLLLTIFFLMTSIFHHCCRTSGITKSPRVTRPLAILYTTTTLVLVRTLYRTIEHSTVPANPAKINPPSLLPPITLHEYFFYIFDAAPMLLALILWNVFHPRGYLPGDSARYLAQDGKTELKGPGWNDSKSLTETFMNPFASLTNRGGHGKPFWERNGYVLGTGGRSGRRVMRAVR